MKTEFGFDVLEVAQGRYAPDSYHDFIGFGVSAPLLEQAFQETYGMDLKEVLSDEDKVLGSYRHDVSQLLPKATRIAWSLKKNEIMKDQPGITKKKFLYNLSRASYQKNWGKIYQQPTFGEKVLATLARIVPKIGPLKVLQLRTPTPETERMFEASFNATLDRYKKMLAQVGTGQPDLPNDNFDTGAVTGPGIYRLNDEAHAKLLDTLAKQNFTGASPELRAEISGVLRACGCPVFHQAKSQGMGESSGPARATEDCGSSRGFGGRGRGSRTSATRRVTLFRKPSSLSPSFRRHIQGLPTDLYSFVICFRSHKNRISPTFFRQIQLPAICVIVLPDDDTSGGRNH